MDRFIARENIRHFRAKLESECDPAKRANLRRLLVEEEDKLARDSELLAELRRHVSDGGRRIERQRDIVATMETEGHRGVHHAKDLLDALLDTQDLLQNYYHNVLSAFIRNE